MRVTASCKFCKKILFLEVADEYAKLGDPMKLIPMAACNRCADLRVTRSKLQDAISRLCVELERHKNPLPPEVIGIYRAALGRLTKDYVRMVAEWKKVPVLAWDKECVDQLLEEPGKWNVVMGNYWRMAEASL